MGEMLRNVLIAVAILAVAGAVLVWYAKQAGGRPSQVPHTAPVKPASTPPVSAAGGDIVQKDKSGAVVWRLKVAGSITGSEQSGSIQANDITFESAAVKAGKAWTAKAGSAYVSYGKSRITFTKGVKAQATDGTFAFTADHADYQMDTRKIVGEGNVKMTFPSGTATAARVIVDTTGGEVRVHGIKGAYSF